MNWFEKNRKEDEFLLYKKQFLTIFNVLKLSTLQLIIKP